MIRTSFFMTASSARIDFSRPTNSGTIMCGKTTMSRRGSTGNVSTVPGGTEGRGLVDVMIYPFLRCHALHQPHGPAPLPGRAARDWAAQMTERLSRFLDHPDM